MRVCHPGSWGTRDSRDQRARLGKASPNTKCPGSSGVGPVLPKACQVPGNACRMPVAGPQQQSSTPRPCSSHCCLPQGPCSTCAAAGQSAAAPGPCSPASPQVPGLPGSPSRGSSRQQDPAQRPGGAQQGGCAAVLPHPRSCRSRSPHLLQCRPQPCPTRPARWHPLQPPQGLVLVMGPLGLELNRALNRSRRAGCRRPEVPTPGDMVGRALPRQAHHAILLGSCDTFACGRAGT